MSLNPGMEKVTLPVVNNAVTLTDLGDGILNLEFAISGGIINADVITGIHEVITLAEQHYKGLVISGGRDNFCAGTDLQAIHQLAVQQQFGDLDKLVKLFQGTMMRVRYCKVPVVAAAKGSALGLGCELCLHADQVVAHTELHIGLDQFRTGLLPFAGGVKEFALRLSDELQPGDIETNNFRSRLLTITQSKVSGSAHESFELGYLVKDRDVVVSSSEDLVAEAKQQCLLLAGRGYTPPAPRKDIRVLGKQVLGVGYLGASSMHAANYIGENEMKLSQTLAFIMAGADLSQPTLVDENYLLGLEREALISLSTRPQNLEIMRAFSAKTNIPAN